MQKNGMIMEKRAKQNYTDKRNALLHVSIWYILANVWIWKTGCRVYIIYESNWSVFQQLKSVVLKYIAVDIKSGFILPNFLSVFMEDMEQQQFNLRPLIKMFT